jgi:hypothetical protein
MPVAGTITGPASVCQGATITLSDAVTGGVWSASNSRATIAALTGIVNGVTAGLDTIRYTVTNSCGTVSASRAITINALPYAGAITGYTSVCAGLSVSLTESVTGGAWSSSNAAVASVSGGVVTGVTVGTATISYSVTNSCGTRSATHAIAVVAPELCHTMVHNTSMVDDIKIYPNPASTTISIEANGKVNVVVMSVDGKKVIAQNDASVLDVSQLADGMYFISIYATDGELLKTAKFAKTR